jgi:periplasmic protein TonB
MPLSMPNLSFVAPTTPFRTIKFTTTIKTGLKLPQAHSRPNRIFQKEARKAKFQGEVTLSIVVDKAGNVARIRVDKVLGHGLDEHSMQALKAWHFIPGIRNGEPVAVRESVSVGFNLY